MQHCSATSSGEKVELEAGSHRYPFTFSIPPEAPSSFEQISGTVRYTAEATIVRPWKFDHVTRSAITVLNILDLNLQLNEFRVIACILSVFLGSTP